MRLAYKPSDHPSISPYLLVDGAADTIDFLRTVFDAEELSRMTDDTGRVRHAEVRLDDSIIMLADSVEGWPPLSTYVHVYVPDVDATYKRALAAGAETIQEPTKGDDPDKRGGVRDAGGTTWWIATRTG